MGFAKTKQSGVFGEHMSLLTITILQLVPISFLEKQVLWAGMTGFYVY